MKNLLLFLPLFLIGCASVDHHVPRIESSYLPVGKDAELDLAVAPVLKDRAPGESAFYVLSDNVDAVAARLRVIQHAERSIDVQYYLIKRDQVGRALLLELLEAADRGVRIRLLVDDMFNKGFDEGMRALDAHPNFEIRVFNPFNRGLLGRNLGAAFRFRRINRRMHNKSFTVDNRLTIIGGRNIADEYFGARPDSAFGDLDVLALGPIVQEVSDMFDLYWAHETAVPLDGFLKPLKDPEAALAAYREYLTSKSAELADTRYAEAVIKRAYQEMEEGMPNWYWAKYSLIYDPPEKGIKNRADESEMIIAPLKESLSGATDEVLIISPYFVPRKSLTEALVKASEKGIRITVLTNSLAANNQKTVHGGYAPYRKDLLKAGVRLLEIRPDAVVPGAEFVENRDSRSTLHTKAYILDREEIFVGSFNFDPRSAFINTELGVLIHHPELGAKIMNNLETQLPVATWEVTLNEHNKLRWTGVEDGETVVYQKEPHTGWWDRFKAGFYRMLPIRSQL